MPDTETELRMRLNEVRVALRAVINDNEVSATIDGLTYHRPSIAMLREEEARLTRKLNAVLIDESGGNPYFIGTIRSV